MFGLVVNFVYEVEVAWILCFALVTNLSSKFVLFSMTVQISVLFLVAPLN